MLCTSSCPFYISFFIGKTSFCRGLQISPLCTQWFMCPVCFRWQRIEPMFDLLPLFHLSTENISHQNKIKNCRLNQQNCCSTGHMFKSRITFTLSECFASHFYTELTGMKIIYENCYCTSEPTRKPTITDNKALHFDTGPAGMSVIQISDVACPDQPG